MHDIWYGQKPAIAPDPMQWKPGEREALGAAIRAHDLADANPKPQPAALPSLAPASIPSGMTASATSPGLLPPDKAAAPAPAPLGEAPLDRPLVGRQAVASSVAGEFRNAGMSENGVGGLLANIKDESGFDPTLRHPDQPHWGGEAHYAHGLFQVGGQEYQNYTKWLEENHTGADWRDPKLQTQFMVQNLKENYPAVWDQMNKAATPGEAAQIFAAGYLKPRADLLQARSDKYAQGVPDVGGFLKGLAGGAQSVVGGLGQGVSRVGEGITSLSGARNEAPAETRGAAPQYTGALGFLNALGVPIPDSVGRVATSLNSMAPILAYAGANKLPNYYGEYQPTQAKLGMEQAQLGPNIAHTQAQTALARAQMYKPEPIGHIATYDNEGRPTTVYSYGQYNAADPTHPIPVGVAGQQSNQSIPNMYSIPESVTGDEFINQAKNLGYTPQQLDIANRTAHYLTDPSKIYPPKDQRRVTNEALAARINPGYRAENYAGAYAATKKLDAGDVANSLSRVGRLLDEVDQAATLADETGNTGSENVNNLLVKVSPSGSRYAGAHSKLATALNNVYESAAAVAKGGGQSAEGAAKRRAAAMNAEQEAGNLKGALATELEVGLRNGQSNLSAYNDAHEFTPDNPGYKSIMDRLTPAQQQKAIKWLGVAKIEELTGKPVPKALQPQQAGGANGNAKPVQQAPQSKQSATTSQSASSSSAAQAAPMVKVNNPDEVKALVAAGKLKSGDQFVDENGKAWTVK